MSIITLVTDFGNTDPYVGIMKGVILSICPDAKIVDISHNITPQNIQQANWILKCSYTYFPKGTIHVCVVDPGVGSTRKPILLETSNYFFIGPDNGIFTAILEQEIIKNAIELREEKYWLKNISKTFHGREIFAPVAAHLAGGVSPKEFGKIINVETLRCNVSTNELIKTKNGYQGIVQYIDCFGNLITNIPDAFLPQKIKGKIKNIAFGGLVSSYSEGEKDKLFAIIGSHGFLELSVNKGSAVKLTGAGVGDKVEIYVSWSNVFS